VGVPEYLQQLAGPNTAGISSSEGDCGRVLSSTTMGNVNRGKAKKTTRREAAVSAAAAAGPQLSLFNLVLLALNRRMLSKESCCSREFTKPDVLCPGNMTFSQIVWGNTAAEGTKLDVGGVF
jgi:hypothetical protein